MATDKRASFEHSDANPSLLLCLDPLGFQRSDKPLGGVIKAWAPSSASQTGSGVWTNANVWPVGHITRSLAIDTGRFVEISIDAPTAHTGFVLSHVSYWMRSYAVHGPRYAALRTSADGFASNVAEAQIDDSLPLTRVVLQTPTCLRLNAGEDAPAEPALHRASRALKAGTLLCRRGAAIGIPEAASDDDCDDTEMEIAGIEAAAAAAGAAAAAPGVAGGARGGAGALARAAAAAAPPPVHEGPGARAGMDRGPLRLRLYFWGATGDDWADVASSDSVAATARGRGGKGGLEVAEAVAEERAELLRCCGAAAFPGERDELLRRCDGAAGADGVEVAVGGVKVWGWPVDFKLLRADQATADAGRKLRGLAIADAAAVSPVVAAGFAAAAFAAAGGAGAAAVAPSGGAPAAADAAAADSEDNYARVMRLAELRASNTKAADAAPGNEKGASL